MKTPVLILTIAMIAAGVIMIVNKPDPPVKRSRVAQPQKKSSLPLTTIEWTDTSYNMGKIVDGDQIEIVYTFKNTGKELLVFSNIQASCGCTIPEKPEKPILPGNTGTIKAVFNSKGRVGSNHKVLTAFANTNPGYQELVFDVEVTPSKQ
ncbi:MAG: DUF1573 domain-containing protein [bacterium]|jgi:hypothetical protein